MQIQYIMGFSWAVLNRMVDREKYKQVIAQGKYKRIHMNKKHTCKKANMQIKSHFGLWNPWMIKYLNRIHLNMTDHILE